MPDKKKILISQPTFDRTDAEIAAALETAVSFLESQGYETVAPIADSCPLRRLARTIEQISEIRSIYFCPGWHNDRHCRIEKQICLAYGIEHING